MFQNKFLKFYKTFENGFIFCKPSNIIYSQKKGIALFMEWFVKIFNGVDRERVKLVGPDCACAEWLLRNSAAVRFKGHSDLLSDYNQLIEMEETGAHQFKIEEIYARDAYLHCIGFEHLRGCLHIQKITLIFCHRLNNSAMFKLSYVKDTLEYLEMRSCFNISDKGLIALCDLSNLKTLILADLVSVENKDKCEAALRKALPGCDINFEKGKMPYRGSMSWCEIVKEENFW